MRIYSLIAGFLLFSLSLCAQIFAPVEWRTKVDHVADNEYDLYFEAKIDKGWTVYSVYNKGEGPIPTSITFESKGFKTIGKIEEFGHIKKGYDKIFETKVTKVFADKPYILKQKVRVEEGTNVISGYLSYTTCNDERCLPPTDVDFNFNLLNEVPQDVADKSGFDVSELNSGAPESKILDPVKWGFDINDNGDGTYDLVASANIEEGWTVYSQYTEGDGPVPTSITFNDPSLFEALGPATENGDLKKGFDQVFETNVTKFLGGTPYTITQKIKPDPDVKIIDGYLNFMTCDDTKCLPPAYIDFQFDLENISALNLTDNAELGDIVQIEGIEELEQRIPSLYESFTDPIGSCSKSDEEEKKSLLWSFIFGFIGGLLALLTPCVFPMIPLTVSFFTKDTKRKGWMNGVIYGISIIIIYVTLGLAISAIFGEEALNRLSTNWIANTIFFLIFVVFAFSFFGFYEITLPSSWSTKSDSMADKGGLIGIFFMAFTLALVSFSCTGPIIGSAIVQAASNQVGPFIVMFGFSLALALPFGLFAAFPAWLNSLPQSGGWMNSVKVILGFLELALAFKFLSVADMTNHWNFLKYEVFMAIWIVIFFLMALYLFGFIKFPHDSPVKKLSLGRWVFGSLAAIMTVYLLTGYTYNDTIKSYNSLKLMSGLAPPSHYNLFLPEPEIDPILKERYPSYSKCANNIDCFKDYYDGLAYAKEVSKPLFVDFTGYGCVNCRKTEEHIWVKNDIRNKLNNDFVLVSLYVDDDKELDTQYISKDRNKKIRNVGNKWADFQIKNFSQNSQPLYVMVTPDEEVISEPRGYKEGAMDYEKYLDCGLETFRIYYSEEGE